MKKLMMAAPIVAIALAGSTACATKKYVRTQTGVVNEKVDTLSKTVEENQERTRANEGRITEVDQKAEGANRAAADARSAADAAGAKAEEVDRASRRLIYELVLSEDEGNFKFGKADLPDEAKMQLDKVVEQLKADPKGYFIEIEGHTDAIGSKNFNHQLGLRRAEAVKTYFYETHQVPLHKMSVISYGEEKPVAGNSKKDERAQNRRVVIKVLA